LQLIRTMNTHRLKFDIPIIMKKRKEKLQIFFYHSKTVRGFILAAIMIIFSLMLYPNLTTTNYSYEIGDVAERDIKARDDFFIEDERATETARAEAAEKVLTVYDRDAALLPRITRQLTQTFDEMRKIVEIEKEKNQNENNPEHKTDLQNTAAPLSETTPLPEKPSVQSQTKADFEKKAGLSVSDEVFKLLEKEGFSKNIPDIVIQIVTQILETGVVANKEMLLMESSKGIMLRDLETKTENATRNLKLFYGPEQYKKMVQIIADPLVKDLGKSLIPVIVDFATQFIQPNITLNRNETEERKKKAAADVKLVLQKIKAGEMVLREGEIVTEAKMLKLKAMNADRRKDKIYARSVGAVSMILCLLLVVYTLHEPMFKNNKDVLFIATLLVAFFFLPKVLSGLFESMPQNKPSDITDSSLTFGIPLASGAMLVCLFMGLEAAVSFAAVIAVCTALIFQNRFEIFIYFFLSGIMAAFWIKECRERKVFITAGVRLGSLNLVLATAVNVYIGIYSGMELFWDWAFAFLGGIGSGIITAGIAPLIEMAFSYTTDITLHELANLDRPILRRLMLEAPGTYHHSVVVGSMVEAAASEIGANTLLARVCGYYHDIGKIKKPLYFIENQTDGINRHNKLAPSMSSLILIAHVKDGVDIGRQNKLGEKIIDTIEQHHGTSLIKFFYEKAKQLKGEDAVKVEEFRYPGPKPQTREAGLVMLADVVEAASRTLENPTPSRIQGHVNKLINGVFTDGQLDDCELTLRDLHSIAKSFNKILNGIHHHRIEYPESSGSKEKKEKKEDREDKKDKNVSSDHQQTKQSKDSPGKSKESSEGSLKRLGVS